MNQEEPPATSRRKFVPKVPLQRKPRLAVPKSEVNDANNDEDEAAAQAQKKLIRKFHENFRRQVPKAEKKSSVQVAFGPGATSSTSIGKYGVHSSENAGTNIGFGIKDSSDDDGNSISSSFSTAKGDGAIVTHALPQKIKKDYIEPWGYDHTYYPMTLPLRRPYSGDPELLNEAEFGEAVTKLEYDEDTFNPASDLGLLEEHDEEKMLFFQLPAKLPVVKRSASAKGKENAEDSISSQGKSDTKKESNLQELSGGYMGKMLVYKSGAVKLKLGDTLYDVSPGSNCIFAQDVMAINTTSKHCCAIGELGKRAIVTPDVDSLLNSVIDLS